MQHCPTKVWDDVPSSLPHLPTVSASALAVGFPPTSSSVPADSSGLIHHRLPASLTTGASSGNICFNCGRIGYFAQECTTLRKNMTQGHVSHLPRGQQKVTVVKTSCVHYTTMEDVPEGEQVLTGTFSLNGHPIIILFNSSSTHNFISKACT
jgi:hypothetical protein